MKKIIIFIFLFVQTLSLKSQGYPFNYERLSIDFNGVVSNNYCILAYGDGGIALRSSNGGEDWEQIAILPDEFVINKIINVDGIFYGCADMNYGTQRTSYLIKSEDGKSWEKKYIPSQSIMKSVTASGNKLFSLATQSILVFNTNMNYISEIPFDSVNKPNEIFAFEEKLFMPVDSGKIITYDINNGYSQYIIDFKSLSICQKCNKPFRMLSENKNLFVIVSGQLLKSSDEGNTWNQIANNLNVYYTIRDNRAYCIKIRLDINLNMSLMDFYRQNNDGSMQAIFSDPPERYVSDYKIYDIKFTGVDTVVAVGTNKLIFISYNGGYNWTLKSNMASNIFNTNVIDEKRIFIADDAFHLFKSTNGGTTFLPQKYTSNTDSIKKSYIKSIAYFYLDTNGFGFMLGKGTTINFNNIYFTNDWGESVNSIYSTWFLNSITYGKIILLKNDTNFILFKPISASGSPFINYKTIILKFDKNFNIISNQMLDSISFWEIKQIDNNGNLIAIGQETKFPEDSIQIKYCLMSSSDFGSTWNIECRFNLPDNFRGCYFPDGLNFCFLDTWSKNPYHTIQDPDNPMISYFYSDWQLHLLDIKNKKFYNKIFFDSLTSALYYFKLFDNNQYLSSHGKLYFNRDINNYPGNWYNLPSIFWEFYGVFDSVAFMRGAPVKGGTDLFKLTQLRTTDVRYEISYTENQDYFYAFPPYPMPARSELRALIYWDLTLGVDNDEINVYDIYGAKICGRERIRIDKLQPYSGYLVWDCSNVPTGVYLIVVKHGTITKTIKAIVNR
jgi:hypothetical protein